MQLDDAAAILSQADFFEICDDEQRRLLAFAGDRRRHSAGDVLYQSGDVPHGAHVLISGRLTVKPDGDAAKPYDLDVPGSVISTMALILAKARPVTILAASGSETLFVPRQAFLKLVQQSPDLAQRAVARIQSDLGAYLGALEPVRAKIKPD